MKFLNIVINGLLIMITSSLLGWGGLLIGHSVIGEYNPPWMHYSIQSTPKEMAAIVQVDIQSTLEDPTGDILYVATSNGKVYSNTLFQSDWLLVDPVPILDNDRITKCAPEWPGPTDAHIWDPPPVGKEVIDSAGIRLERPISIISRCYVLLEDGSLEVWVHSGNAMDSLPGELRKIGFALFGAILGVIIGVIITRFRKRVENSTT